MAESKEKWSGDVKEKWHPPEGFFKKSAQDIAKGLKENSKNEKQAMSRLTFYINRAGKNLSEEDKRRLENAKTQLKKLYEKEEAKKKQPPKKKPVPKTNPSKNW